MWGGGAGREQKRGAEVLAVRQVDLEAVRRRRLRGLAGLGGLSNDREIADEFTPPSEVAGDGDVLQLG